ncbi:MAG: serine/threonine-protein kinase [Caldilineaceae bacterium]
MDFQGSTVGPYQIQGELGRGGTAIVYRALDTRNGQAVALKILPPQLANDAIFLKRFIKEGQHATQLTHESIVKTYEAGEIEGIYYLAMELVKGGTLAELSSKREELLPIDEVIDILSQIAAALDFAHSQGFVHRDVKPSNILIGEDGRSLLTDFGTAKQLVLESTMMTGTGQRIGTPSFMSPEQITGEIALDYRTDVYSLGVIAYKLFTGRLPFIAGSQAELLHKVVYEDPLPADAFNPDLPPNIVYNLRRALAKEPSERYDSAGQFVASLVAGQMLAAKIPLKAAGQDAASAKARKRPRNPLPVLKRILRPVSALLVISALFFAPAKLRELASPQMQSEVIAKADYYSGILMRYLDTPQTQQLWTNYAEPIMTEFRSPDAADTTVRGGLQTIWHNIVTFNDPNGWVQRTWRKWNQTKVSDLVN